MNFGLFRLFLYIVTNKNSVHVKDSTNYTRKSGTNKLAYCSCIFAIFKIAKCIMKSLYFDGHLYRLFVTYLGLK